MTAAAGRTDAASSRTGPGAGGRVVQGAPDLEIKEFPPAGGRHTLRVPFPRLDGMTGLEVLEARVQLTGTAVSLPRVDRTDLAADFAEAHAVALDGGAAAPAGSLVEVVLSGFAVRPRASTGWPGGRVTLMLESTAFPTDGSGGPPATGVLHFLIAPRPSGGAAPVTLPPLALAPRARELYGITGGTLSVAGTEVTMRLQPPIDARDVELLLVTRDALVGSGAEAGRKVEWSAARVRARWATEPRDLEITAATPGGPSPVASLVGPLAGARDIDFAPIARNILGRAVRDPAGDGPLTVDLTLAARSAGKLRGAPPAARLRYFKDAVPEDGLALSLQGDPTAMALAIAPGYRPASCSFTIDGQFGRARLAAATDLPPTGFARSGIRLEGARRAARFVPLDELERTLPIVRVGVLGRARDAAELLIELHLGDAATPGAAWGDPVALAIAPSIDGVWHRAAVPARPPLPRSTAGIWLVASAPRGAFHWYARQTAASRTVPGLPGDALEPWAQLHVETPEAEPAPLALSGPSGRLSDDVLAGPRPATAIAAAPATADRASFRRDLAPLTGRALAAVANQGATLRLHWFCRRDVALRVLGARLTYDPATAGGST